MHDLEEMEMGKKLRNSIVKKLAAVMLVMGMILSLAGCVRYEIKLTIHEDGSTDIDFIYAMLESSNTSESTQASMDQAKSRLREAGFIVMDYFDSDNAKADMKYRGFTASYEGYNIDEIQQNIADEELEDFDGITITKEDDVYTFTWNMDKESTSTASSSVTPDLLDSYDGYMRFVLVIPGKVIESNASSKSGKTLTWNLLETDSYMYAKFTLTGGNGIPMWVIGLIIAGVIIIAGVVIMLLIMKKKKSEAAYDYSSPYIDQPAGGDSDSTYSAGGTTGLPGSGADDDVEVDLSGATPIWNRPDSEDGQDAEEELNEDEFLQ